MDQVDLMDQMDKTGASCDTPRVCGAVGGCGAGEDLPLGYARQLDGNGGVRVAWAWHLCLTSLTSLTCLTSWCAPVYPEGLLAAVWYGSGEDLPSGENKTNSAARLEESAAAPTGKFVRDF